MSALITFTAAHYKTKETFRGSANLKDNAPWDVREFVEQLEMLDDGEITFNHGENADNTSYDSVADFVQTNPEWFHFYDDNRNEINPDEVWGDFYILSYF